MTAKKPIDNSNFFDGQFWDISVGFKSRRQVVGADNQSCGRTVQIDILQFRSDTDSFQRLLHYSLFHYK